MTRSHDASGGEIISREAPTPIPEGGAPYDSEFELPSQLAGSLPDWWVIRWVTRLQG